MSDFAPVSDDRVPEIASRVRHLRHRASGIDVVSIENADPVSAFCIAFRTSPADDTGAAHILEHCALSGSRRYPVRAPFVEMLKGSLQCHLNASTWPDLTLYPVASGHPRDFENLVSVYLDAVFFPLLTQETFDREAWRRAPDGAGGGRIVPGVVMNEMRGALASAAGRLDDLRRRTLFPDTPLARCYGGDPDRIPDLDLAGLRTFHRRHYRGGNAVIALSGAGDPEARLAWLSRHLDGVPCGPSSAPPRRLAPLAGPQRHAADYIGGPGDDRYVAVSWRLPEGRRMLWEALDDLLTGSSEGLFGRRWRCAGTLFASGVFDEAATPYLSFCLRGAEEDAESGILATLDRIVRDGVDPAEADAAVATVAMRRAIRDDLLRPESVAFATEAAVACARGASPADGLRFARACDALRDRIACGEPVFERAIRDALLATPQRVTLTLTPTPSYAHRRASPSAASPLAPDKRPEATQCLPALHLADLPRDPPPRPLRVERRRSHAILVHPRATNGIAYLDLGFDIAGIETEYLCLVPLLGRAMVGFGAGGQDAAAFATRIGGETGGVTAEVWTGTAPDGSAAARLFLRGAVRVDGLPSLAAILRDAALDADLSDPARLSRLVASEIGRIDGLLAARGHDAVDRLLGAQMHDAGVISEATEGFGYLGALRDMRDRLLAGDTSPLGNLHRLRDRLLATDGMICAATLDARAEDRAVAACEAVLADLPGSVGPGPEPRRARSGPVSHARPAPAHCVGRGFALGRAIGGSMAAAASHLSLSWLWDQVREAGGAYGAQARWSAEAGLLRLVSFRDPHLLRTLDAFGACAERLGRPLARADLTRCVIGAVGALDRPLHPRAAGFAATTDWAQGTTEMMRAKCRVELLGTSPADMLALAQALHGAAGQPYVAVIGPAEALRRGLEARPGLYRLAGEVTGS